MDSCRFPSCSQMLSCPGLAYSLTSSVLPLKPQDGTLCHILQHISSKTCADDLNPTLRFEAILSATAASGSLKQRHQPIPTVVMDCNHLSDHVSDHLSAHLSIHLSINLSTSIHLSNSIQFHPMPSVHASVHPSVHPSIHLYVSNPIYLFVCLSIHPSIYPSVHPSIYLPNLSVYLSLCLCVYLSICLSVCLSVYLSSVCLSVYLYNSSCI